MDPLAGPTAARSAAPRSDDRSDRPRPAPADAGRRPGLVRPAWLAEHLDDPTVRVVEVDVSPTRHAAGHIPGAVLWDIYADLKDPDHQLAGRAAVEALVQRSRIEADSTVVFYGYGPALGLWLLRWYGHRAVRLLDGGRDAWREDGRPWTTAASSPTPSAYVLGGPVDGLRATRSEVLAAIGQPRATLVDVRTIEEFEGERFWPSGGMEDGGRAGYVPGARRVAVDDLLDATGAFRPTPDLAARFADLRPFDDAALITYCTIGGRAATAWFVLTYLLGAPDVRVYDGSWAEWGRTPDAPVERNAIGGRRAPR